MGVHKGGGKTSIYPLGNLDEESKASRKQEVSIVIPMNLFNSCIDSFFAGMTLTLHKIQRQVAKLATDCSIVGLYCVTITWQQIFKDSV